MAVNSSSYEPFPSPETYQHFLDVCRRFEDDFRNGQSPRIDEELAKWPEPVRLSAKSRRRMQSCEGMPLASVRYFPSQSLSPCSKCEAIEPTGYTDEKRSMMLR
jgi:hypothetical protein